MKALFSHAGGASRAGTRGWWSFSVGYFLDLIQIVRVQSLYFLIWRKEKIQRKINMSYHGDTHLRKGQHSPEETNTHTSLSF